MEKLPWGPVSTRHVCRVCRRNAVSISPYVKTSFPGICTVSCAAGHTWDVRETAYYANNSDGSTSPRCKLVSEPKLLILISGGIDSTLLAANAPFDTEYLFVHYGQPSAGSEYQAACDVLSILGMKPAHVAHLSGMDFQFNVGANIIPGRNNILVALGVSKAMQMGCEIVLIGACKNDAENYADCRPEWLQLLNNFYQPLGYPAVGAPLMDMEKKDIHDALLRLSPEAYAHTYSCYAAEKCGQCDSCKSNHVLAN